ncbi:BglG family transcription antiterminator [Bacillus sp. T33-2]|uniref:BglG family transcription antiterminator n=1 Tax=Bacillus sp. T33-2 TaxID=2054168 RepID=UPI000C75EA4C|nr:BglG family transcription antiterminator [Bacillus sp. T33-2]PLR95937.1 transcriptional antiterminator [Bacillus sp. T33-2]
MNNRQKELLRLLLVKEEGAFQIRELSEELDCAEKTVRNDLDRLEELLKDYPGAVLIRKPGFGISLQIAQDERLEILRNLFSNEPKTMEERLFEMAFQLLTGDKAFTLQYWSDRYYVSKAAIKKDLETISNWLQRYDLEIVSKQRLGNVVEGTELKKRTALAHLPELIPSFSKEKNVVLDLFLPYEITAVKKALKDMQGQFSIAFTDGALDSLLIHALIMVKRIRQKSPVFVQESEMEKAAARKEYQYAGWFFDRLETSFQLTFPEVERVYFTWHLVSGKRSEEGAGQILGYEEQDAELVHALIRKMGKLTLFPFEEDPILKSGLAVHMHSVISRIKYGLPITNPLLANIKKMYPYMFSMVIFALEEINDTFELDIPEDEAAYIVLHFQASIERLESRKGVEKKKVLIVCHMGIGMSHLLEAKIEQQYQDIEVTDCIGKAEVGEYLKKTDVDFIISTVPLERLAVQHIVISPLFGQEDKKKLNRFIGELKVKNPVKGQGGLSAFMSGDLMFFGIEKEHRYEAVELLAMELFHNGFVKKEFVHNALGRERKSATAIGGGVAIPHGDPSLILKPALAVAVLNKPLDWGNEQVSLVFMIAMTKDHQADIRGIISHIAALSESPLVVNKLIKAKDHQEFTRMLNEA